MCKERDAPGGLSGLACLPLRWRMVYEAAWVEKRSVVYPSLEAGTADGVGALLRELWRIHLRRWVFGVTVYSIRPISHRLQ